MSNEIQFDRDYDATETLYFVVRNSAGLVWYIVGAVFEVWGTGGRGANDYDYAITNDAGGRCNGDFPVAITTAGRYTWEAYLQDSTNPADGDGIQAGGGINWNGTAEVFVGDNDGRVDVSKIEGSDATDQMTTAASAATPAVTVSDKTGFKLASDGLDSVAVTEPSGVASNFREMLVAVWMWFFRKTAHTKITSTTGEIKTYNSSDVAVTKQATSDSGSAQTRAKASNA